MKFGEHLLANISPEYGADSYLNYDLLDDIIRELAETAPSRYVWDGSTDSREEIPNEGPPCPWAKGSKMRMQRVHPKKNRGESSGIYANTARIT